MAGEILAGQRERRINWRAVCGSGKAAIGLTTKIIEVYIDCLAT